MGLPGCSYHLPGQKGHEVGIMPLVWKCWRIPCNLFHCVLSTLMHAVIHAFIKCSGECHTQGISTEENDTLTNGLKLVGSNLAKDAPHDFARPLLKQHQDLHTCQRHTMSVMLNTHCKKLELQAVTLLHSAREFLPVWDCASPSLAGQPPSE